ncbi:hypothetical protein [Subdoligranulum variabile]|nr:hypothetical protein [Subdoligranulum variabile]UWP67340.1 hypothetical protein NQ490_10340 [Subdoligranulum variabile]
MKHLVSFGLTAVLVLSLTACAAPPRTPAPETARTPETATAETAAEPSGFYRTGSTFNTGACFYSLQPHSPGYFLVTETDYATASRRALCSIPGCAHDSSDCPAWFPGTGLEYSLFTAGEDVYLYHSTPAMAYDGSWEQYRAEVVEPALENPGGHTEEELIRYYQNCYREAVTPACLYRIGEGGAVRETIELSRQIPNIGFSWCDGVALYGEYSGQNGDTEGYRISLADGQVTTFPMMANELIRGAEKDRLLTSRIVTDAPLPDPAMVGWDIYEAAMQNTVVEFDWLNPSTGTRSKVLEQPGDGTADGTAAFRGLANGMLYFVNYGEDEQAAVRALDSATGQWQTVLQTLPDPAAQLRSEPTAALPEAAESQARYLRLDGSDVWQGLNLGWILDSESGELHTVSQKVEGALYETAVMPLALTDDGRFLLCTAQKDSGEEPISAYGITDLRVEDCYSLQPVEDFLQGRTNYTPVTMPE